jgi:hypothetical protein
MSDRLKLLDFRRRHTEPLYLLGLTLTLIVLCAGTALAQQTLELPMPHSQATRPLRPHAQPTAPPANNVQTIPAAPPPAPEPQPQAEEPPPAPQPQPQAEEPPPPAPAPALRQPAPVLPAVFRGCWRGVVDDVDRMQQLPGAIRPGLWMPKTYMMCYRRTGNGPFQLTFTSAGVEGTNIINSNGQLQVISTDGRSYARMRAYLHFDEFHSHKKLRHRKPMLFGTPGGASSPPVSGPPGSSTFAVDEVTDLQCTIEPDGMHATGVVYGEREGAPWFRAWWHTTFFHVANLSE